MDAFSYLSVLLSIILGLAITQILQGYRALILARHRVRGEGAALVWSGLLLLFATQAWWASFGLRDHQAWTFAGFAVLLLQMVLLYMMAAIVLPDVRSEGVVDLAAHHAAHRRILFSLLLAVLAVSLLKDRVIDGRWPSRENFAFHAVLGGAAVLGIVLPGRRAQLALAVGAAVWFGVYTTLLFARL